MAANAVVQLKTAPVDGEGGPAVAIMIAVNVNDPATAEAFVAEVAERFKVQRMVSTPDTSMLLVTLVGDMTAQRFAARWREVEAGDEVVGAFMSLMTNADVIQGTKSGRVLSRASLMPGRAPGGGPA